MPQPPRISIITICYNAADELAETIRNVRSLNWPDIEYIVVDGGSTDHTLQVIHENEGFISKWVSEKDKGIYDAMQKGVALATGEWINFMNAGDTFHEPDLPEKIFSENEDPADVIYGDYIVQYDTFSETRKALPLDEVWTSVRFCHQSAFYRKSMLETFPFAEGLIVADFEQAWRIFRSGGRFRYYPGVVARFAHTGLSSRRKNRIQREIEQIITKTDKRPGVRLLFLRRRIWVFLTEALRGLLPARLFEKIQAVKNKKFVAPRGG